VLASQVTAVNPTTRVRNDHTQPRAPLRLRTQIDDANVMGDKGGGDNLEAEGFSPEYLLDRCDTVFLFGMLRPALGGLTSSMFMDRDDLGVFVEPHSGRKTSTPYIRCRIQCQ